MSAFAVRSIRGRADLPARYRQDQLVGTRDQISFWLSILLLFLLPIQRLMIPYGLALADMVLILLTLYGFARAWRRRQRLDFPLLLPMWLILLSSSVATLVGFAHFNSIVAIAQEIYIFAWFIALTNILSTFSVSDLDRLMKVWSVVASLEALTTVMGMFRIGPNMFYAKPNVDVDVAGDVVRAVGTFVNSNAAAVYLSVSLFVALATSWPTWLRLGLGTWILAGIFGTGSNGALLSTLGSLVIVGGVHLIVRRRQDIKFLGGIIGIGMGIVAILLFILSFSPSLLSGFGFDASEPLLFYTLGRFSHSLASRFEIIGWAWEVYRRHPWGTGPNSFAVLGGSLHNDYAAFWFERGPLGIIAWLWMIGATLFRSVQAAHHLVGRRQRWQVLALGAGFLGCAVNAFSHEVSHMRQVWVLMGFLFALSHVNIREQKT
jgi:hypothetical protein